MLPIEVPRLDLVPVLPELIVVGTAILVLLVDAIRPIRDRRPLLVLSLLGLGTAGGFAVSLWSWDGPPTVLGGMVSTDRFGVFFRLVVLASAVLALLLSHAYLERNREGRGEFYPLLLFAASGMMLLSASADLVMVVLSLEILSLSLYVMAAFSRRRVASQEAGLKYFLLGAFSSAFFLYGIAFAYGATGTTSIGGIAQALSGETGADLTLALIGAALLIVGFGFKVAAVPFHMWTPDVYQGAPSPVTAFMAAGTKVAGFAALIRVASVALGPVAWDLRPALWVIAALTMLLGSTIAIAQRDLKRMLAYSSIGHAGFVLVGVVASNQAGISGAMFYLAAYAAMILGAFGVVTLVSRREEGSTSLEAYAGLARRSPVLAALLGLFMLSLAGIPPAAGFIAKVVVFQAAVNAGLASLVVVAMLASVVAAFFYLRVIVLMYMQEPTETEPIRGAAGPGIALAASAIVTVVLGVAPGFLLDLIRSASVIRW